MLYQWNLRSHDTPCLDLDGIVHRNRRSDILDKTNTKLNIGFLKCLVGFRECGIDLCLNVLCLVDQAHQFPKKDIPLFIHQLVTLARQGKGILC